MVRKFQKILLLLLLLALQLPQPAYLLAENQKEKEIFLGTEEVQQLKSAKQELKTAKDAFSRADCLYRIGDLLRTDNKNLEAVTTFNQALMESRKSKAAAFYTDIILWKRGLSYEQLGKLPEALKDMTESISNFGPGSTDTTRIEGRARVYAGLHDYKKAIADLDQALKNNETNLKRAKSSVVTMARRADKCRLLYARAKIYKQLGKTAAAASDRMAADLLTDEL